MHARKIRNRSGQLIQQKKTIIKKITDGLMVMIQVNHTHRRNAKEQFLDTNGCYAMRL